ncbi:hypothetical protein ABZ281_04080 [Streptomyces sp. NPDC006265]|uniref:hypothetical protein n=1 Tax=Streptomyces sp. NPDC006265 TaxID=3156740 RepID=UPI0033AF281D
MNKKLDIGNIRSDLEGSSFFSRPVREPSSLVPESGTFPKLADHNLPVRPNDRPPVRPPGKRIITRNSFELYEDQMDSLRDLAYLEKRQGKMGSMSAMVRQAIDNYLQEHSPKK